jgi:hypothetical protein
VIESFQIWLESTALHQLPGEYAWLWPASETLHFLGLSMLIGMVGQFDLRLLCMAKSIPVAALHRLIPFGVMGYLPNVMTGIIFLAGTPDQYLYNSAFRFKMLFMALAGLNVLVFYSSVFREVGRLSPGEATPLKAKIIGGASLLLWVGVMTCGRLLTFYRP